MSWLRAILIAIPLLVVGLGVAVWVSFFLAANRFDHFDDPILGYLREHQEADRKLPLVPGLFKEGEVRVIVIERLRGAGFEPAARCSSDAPSMEVWANSDKTYLFCVELRFSTGRLVDAVGRVYGPNLK